MAVGMGRWTCVDPPTAVFQSIYSYLDEAWAHIPPPARKGLQGAPPSITPLWRHHFGEGPM
jgi:hypothetical protein